MSYNNRICPYCGVSPIKATPDMTQAVGQRDGLLFTHPHDERAFRAFSGSRLSGLHADEVIAVVSGGEGEVTVIINTDAATRTYAFNVGGSIVYHAEIRGGYLWSSIVDEEDPSPIEGREIQLISISGAIAGNVKIYER